MPDLFWTPHSGYHWNHSHNRFFEGWYFRLTLPAVAESFAFMYSIDDPSGHSSISGGAAQILGPGEQYVYCAFPHANQFWAWPHCLGLGHWGTASSASAQHLPAGRFFPMVERGYQVTATRHQGCLEDSETGAITRWDYTIKPIYGWGRLASPQLPTAGWLSYLPIFEPGWQVLMAHGLATGWAEWQDQRYEFSQAPAYAEKNWGGAFPERWFWMQCNSFDNEPDLTVTAAGGLRQVLGFQETVGLVGLHYQDQFISLSSLQARIAWNVAPWGSWELTVDNHRYRITLTGKTDRKSVAVRVPTRIGLKPVCWDTTLGHLTLKAWHKSAPNAKKLIVSATSKLAGLEVGGTGWSKSWEFS